MGLLIIKFSEVIDTEYFNSNATEYDSSDEQSLFRIDRYLPLINQTILDIYVDPASESKDVTIKNSN